MLRLSCPAAWAAILIRAAFDSSGDRPAARSTRWVNLDNGQSELLLGAANQREVETQVQAMSFTVHALHEEAALDGQLPDPQPGSADLWITSGGRWRGRAVPFGAPNLSLPAVDIDELWLPGPGLHQLSSSGGTAEAAGRRVPRLPRSGSSLGWLLAAAAEPTPNGWFSRQAGALGWPAIDAVRARRYALVGCGRNGHALALQLAAWEPREIVLIDPDTVEPGNRDAGIAFIDAMSAGSSHTPTDRGGAKVHAMAEMVQRQTPLTRILAVNAPIESMRALRAAAACDVIISATDHDGARLVCAAVAQSYHRVHLDLGSLVSHDTQGRVALGADVRLLLPGERDLCCLGGFAMAKDLEDFALSASPARHSRWQDRKGGALTSWSSLVAGLAMRMLEDLAAGKLSQSRWVRMTQAEAEHVPSLVELSSPSDPYCPLCAIAGHGGSWLHRMRDLAAAALIRERQAR